MTSCHHWPIEDDDPLDEEAALAFWRLPMAFAGKRHTEKIETFKTVAQTWRMKERMKTVSVALVLCLNVGVDPPDVVKISPCARLQCWIDPLQYSDPTAANNQKAVEIVGANLQRQYERWQPRARYKLSLDPTIDEVKKLCISLRRNAKDERVLFHYNGHGVPRPTQNGEIWVFNKHFTQYIPLSVCDLQMWMGTPSIYVFDCSNAGTIVNFLKATPVPLQFTENESTDAMVTDDSTDQTGNTDLLDPSNSCIQLAACAANEILPMNPELPADLFTSCLTTPIKIALQWYVLQRTSKLVLGITLDLVDKIPGQLNDRRTMLGELNWIFTAITDTIAWNILPRELFQKLFRQDLLVASLFRNFLLAERIMRSYNCSPVSMPKLPPTFQHSMWQAWDLAMDSCLSQLSNVLDDPSSFKNSTFFAEQLTGFQVWLTYGSDKRSPPEQLPIVLQVLLSQVHRQRALELLGRFLDLGPWAVNLSLSVGIFPYVLKLLQSSARELRPLLVFIWAKLLAVDSSCQTDLVKDNGHRYFLAILSDQYMPSEHRMMAAFVLTMIVNNYPTGQEVALQGNLIALCLEHLGDKHSLLKQWLALCLGKVWTNYDAARWYGVRDSAHEKLYPLLSDSVPEVRAAAVFALGTFINNSTERDEQINNIDHGIATKLLTVLQDGSIIVRKELVVALSGLVMQFESQFTSVAYQFSEEETAREYHTVTGTIGVFHSPNEAALFPGAGMRRSASTRCLKGMLSPVGMGADAFEQTPGGSFKRIASTSSVVNAIISGYGNVYSNVWKAFLYLANDASSSVAELAKRLITHIKHKVMATTIPKTAVSRQRKASAPGSSGSAPSSPSNRPGSFMPSRVSEGTDTSRPTTLRLDHLPTLQRTQNNTQYLPTRRLTTVESISEREDEISSNQFSICTEFFEWCCKYFTESMMRRLEEHDPEGPIAQERDYRYTRAARALRLAAEERAKTKISRFDDPVFMNRNLGIPSFLRFHPYESHLVVGDKDHISVWDWEQSCKLNSFSNRNPRHTRITYAEFINAHDRALLVTGSDDGGVKVWRNYSAEDNCQTEMVTAWQALSDMLPTSKGSGIVMDWEQTTGTLYTSGDVRFVRIWDVQTELRVQDLPTNADSCITSLSLDRQSKSIFVGGCGDGNVRVFDKRLPPSDCVVKVFREHPTWVVKAYTMQNFPNRVVSASTQGDIRLWDLRTNESVNTINTQQGLTAVDAHQYSELLACGSVQQFVAVYNHNGEAISTIKYHEGFMGQRIGQVTCLAFHPLKVKLAVGSTDQFVNVYSSTDSRKR